MDAIYYFKRKFFSFLVSAILHTALLILFLTVSFKIYKALQQSGSINQNKSAAKVTFGGGQSKRRVAPAVQPKDASQEDILQTVIPRVEAPKNEPVEAKQKQEIIDVDQRAEEVKSNISRRPIVSSVFDPEVNREISFTENIKRAYLQKKLEQNKNAEAEKKKNVTASSIFKSYRQAYQREQEETGIQASQGLSSENRSSSQRDDLAFLQERLLAWHIEAYKQKVGQNLIKASKWFKKDVHLKESFYKKLEIVLAVNENTYALKVPPEQLTGNDAIDESIVQFLHSVELPPLPKKLKGQTFMIKLYFHMDCPRGSHTMRFIPM